VRHWMHVGLVGLDGTKMSSPSATWSSSTSCQRAEAAAVRLALLDHHTAATGVAR